MPKQPTIHDILGYLQDWETGSGEMRARDLGDEAAMVKQVQMGGRPTSEGWQSEDVTGGREKTGEYLWSLLKNAKLIPEEIGVSGYETILSDKNKFETDRFEDTLEPDYSSIFSQLFQQGKPFEEMSREDLSKLFQGEIPTGYDTTEMIERTALGKTTEKPRYTDIGWDLDEFNKVIDALMGLQEGIGRTKSIYEGFGLEDRLARQSTGTQRKKKTALESYLPQEMTSRYATLQGKPTEAMGEFAEAEYLGKLSSAEREQARGTRSIYQDLEDKMFGGYEKWLENMMS